MQKSTLRFRQIPKRTYRQTIVLACLLIFLTAPVFTQELELAESHEEVLNNILRLNILVTVSATEEDAPWRTELNKLTIPGRTVSLTLENNEIKIQGGFTPYHNNNTLMLLAQAQVTILPTEDSRLRYYTSMKTLSITLGEKIHFFPLGQQKKIDLPRDSWDIEIELQVVAFQPTEDEKKIMDGLISEREKAGKAQGSENQDKPKNSGVVSEPTPRKIED